MADAMFGALTHRADVRADSASAVRSAAERLPLVRPRYRVSGGVTDAPGRLRSWFGHLHALLEPPIGREQVARTLLDILQEFFPARQSALFVLETRTEARTEAGTKKGAGAGNKPEPYVECEALVVAAARGAALSLDEAIWIERTARESLSRCQVLGRESSDGSLSSFLWVPVLFEGRRIGVIELGDCRGHWFSGGRTRELSVLADDVGRVLVRLAEIASGETTIDTLRDELRSRTRESREMERSIMTTASRDAISQLAMHIAEEATDPGSYVLANLQTARDDIEAMQAVVNRLSSCARELVDRLPENSADAELEALRNALDSAEQRRFRSFLGDLAPLIEDVEEGTHRLKSIGQEFRELALGDAAPMDWVNLAEVIERALGVVSHGARREPEWERRIGELPPVRCQRMRIESLLVSVLGRAMECASGESSLGIAAELRGSQVMIDVSVEGRFNGDASARLVAADQAQNGSHVDPGATKGGSFFSPEQEFLNREIAEDHAGSLRVDTLEELISIRLSLPVDCD